MNRILLILWLAALPLAHAQQGEADPKEIWASVEQSLTLPERAAWRLDFSHPEGAATPGPGVKSITSTRTGDLQCDVIQWNGGETSEAWWIGGDYLADDPGNGNILFMPSKKDPAKLGWISWVSENNFRGIRERGGVKCAYFEDEVPWLAYWPGFFTGDTEGGSRLKVAAWFSAKDGTLLALQTGETTAKFTWLENPSTPLVAPAKFAEKRTKIRDRISKKFPRSSRP